MLFICKIFDSQLLTLFRLKVGGEGKKVEGEVFILELGLIFAQLKFF